MTKDTRDILEHIYQGEVSAAETYKQALEKVGDDPASDELMTMQRDHLEAARTLRRHLNLTGGDAPKGSGAWGTWAKTVMGTAKLFGDKSALKALKEGEEHGLKQYRNALDENVDPSVKSLFTETFIPRQENHIQRIDHLIERAS